MRKIGKWCLILLVIVLLGSIAWFALHGKTKSEGTVSILKTVGTIIKSTDIDVKKEEQKPVTDPETDILPSSKRLALVQSVQENEYYCGCACVQMVLGYHGIEKSQTELADELHTVPVTGTEYVDLARVVNYYLFGSETISEQEAGYHVQTIAINDQNPQIALDFEARVKQDISTNDPVFAAIDVHALYPELKSGNHLIVITGYECYDNRDDIAYYYYIDPSYVVQDVQYGGLKKVKANTLVQAIITNEEPAYIW